MFYVYVLKSKADDDLYIGSTKDLKKRLLEHNSGKVLSTAPRRPFEVVYYESYKAEKDSRKRETSLKLRGNARRFLVERISESIK